MSKIKSVFNNLEGYVLAVLMGVIAVVVFVQVVFRQIGQSLPWSEELTRYLLVWVTFLGASQGVKSASHVGVEAFMLIFPMKARKIVNIAVMALCIFFCAIIVVYSIQIIQTQMANSQKSPAMQIPMWWAYAAMPVGMTLMTVRYVQVVLRSIKKFGEDRVITGLED